MSDSVKRIDIRERFKPGGIVPPRRTLLLDVDDVIVTASTMRQLRAITQRELDARRERDEQP